MHIYIQEGSEKFSCLAGECRHSCCQIWEIAVDGKSAARYRALKGALGDKLRKNLYRQGWEWYFRLEEDGRCPFLQGDGLCELIVKQGPDMLCNICAQHPRYRNVYSGRVEVGLGLCCEAAGALLLGRREKARWAPAAGEETGTDVTSVEGEFLRFRQDLFDRIQNRDIPLMQRMEGLLPPEKQDSLLRFLPMLLHMEDLFPEWRALLEGLQRDIGSWQGAALPSWLEIPLEQLAFCLFSRNLFPHDDPAEQEAELRYCLLMLRLIIALCARQIALFGAMTLDQLVEFARIYSTQMEYSSTAIGELADAMMHLI